MLDRVEKGKMVLTITPSVVNIGDTLTYTCTELYPDTEFCVGAHIAATGTTWCVSATSDADGNLTGTYYIGENLRDSAAQIDEFVVQDAVTGGVYQYTPLTIQVAPPPGPGIPKELLILGGIAAVAGLYYVATR